MARADLYLQSTPQLFKQAAVSYKASIWIFLTIALLSPVYKTAIHRATDLSGFSIDFNDTSLTVDFDFRGKFLFPIHSDDKPNEVKQGGADSLLARFLSALFAATRTTNGAAEELVHIADSQVEKDELVQTENQQYGLTEKGDQLADGMGGKIKQSNEMGKTQNENHYESEGIGHVKPNEQETVHILLNESEDTQSEKLVQLKNPSENNDLDESGVTVSEKLNQLESDSDTAHSVSPNEPGSTHIENSTELEKELDGAPDADGNAIEDGDEIIQPAVVGSLKMVHKFGNETKKITGKKLHDQRARTSSLAGIFDQVALPTGAERTLVLVLCVIMLVSFSTLLVVTLQGAFILRVVAFAVTSTHMSKSASVKQLLRSSLRSGIWKLMWFAIMIWFFQELQTQFLAKIFFGEVLENHQIEKLVYRLSIMPFSILAPRKDDLATGIGMFFRIGGFVSFQYLFDWLIYSTYIVGCWVAIMESEYSGREALNKGWNLVKNMAFQAAIIKILEAFFCGRSFSWMLKNIGGQFFTYFTVTLVQVYFLVVWLIFYFAARCKENEGERRNFSHQDLEDFLDKLR